MRPGAKPIVMPYVFTQRRAIAIDRACQTVLPIAEKTRKMEDGFLKTATIDRAAFREAMSRVPAAVHLVTTDGAAGRRGLTVTSACSVSDDPATLLVCLNVSSPTNDRFEANGCFAVNLLSTRCEALARAFAGEGALEPGERFAMGRWTAAETGAPMLVDALVSFDCRLIDAKIIATHRVLIGEVVAMRIGVSEPALLYFDRGFHRL